MAIARDSDGVWDSSHDTPVNGSIVVPAGLSNSILVVCAADTDFEGDQILNSLSSDQDGALTQIGSNVNHSTANAQMWRLLSPAAATHVITPTYGDSANDKPTAFLWHLWTGVDQTTPFGTPATASASSDSPSVTATTASGEVVLDILAMQPGRTETEGADQTKIQGNSFTSGTEGIRGATSQQAGANGGVMSWSLSPSSTNWALLAVSMKPAAAATDPASLTESPLTRSRLTNTPLVRRSMEKLGNLWVPSRTIVTVPDLQFAR